MPDKVINFNMSEIICYQFLINLNLNPSINLSISHKTIVSPTIDDILKNCSHHQEMNDDYTCSLSKRLAHVFHLCCLCFPCHSIIHVFYIVLYNVYALSVV